MQLRSIRSFLRWLFHLRPITVKHLPSGKRCTARLTPGGLYLVNEGWWAPSVFWRYHIQVKEETPDATKD